MHFRLTAIFAVTMLSLTTIASFAQAPTQGQALIDKVSPSIVTVKVVIKAQMSEGGQSHSEDTEVPTEGVVVTSDGLIMMSNAPVSSEALKRLLGFDEERDLTVSPVDFKVTIGNEEKPYTGFLAATDEKLGLAFVKIEDLNGRKLTAVDFSNCPAIHVGDDVAAVTRLGKGYDYAGVYAEGPVKGSIDKPRAAFLLSTTIVSVGLPVFTIDGSAVGVMVFLPVGVDDDSASSLDIMMRYYSGAAADRLGIFLIAGSTVQPIISEAIDQATKLAADRAKNPPPPVTPTPPTPKPTTPATPAPATPPAAPAPAAH